MICLEVIVNGQRRTIAGASAAESIETSVLTYPELQQSWLAPPLSERRRHHLAAADHSSSLNSDAVHA